MSASPDPEQGQGSVCPHRRSVQQGRVVLKEGAGEGDDARVDFALVARDLAGGRPLDAMPIAARIAAATVEAFMHR
jgi:hypothetical protein